MKIFLLYSINILTKTKPVKFKFNNSCKMDDLDAGGDVLLGLPCLDLVGFFVYSMI